MDEEVTTRFKTTFDAVSTQFERTFHAYLVVDVQHFELTDPRTYSKQGLRLLPTTRVEASITQLTFWWRTCLYCDALLFAILEVKPVPFCLLDEVEAALDEANVARYGRYLKRNLQTVRNLS